MRQSAPSPPSDGAWRTPPPVFLTPPLLFPALLRGRTRGPHSRRGQRGAERCRGGGCRSAPLFGPRAAAPVPVGGGERGALRRRLLGQHRGLLRPAMQREGLSTRRQQPTDAESSAATAAAAGCEQPEANAATVAFTLTPAMIARIFEKYPRVQRSFLDNVPHNLSEGAFWHRYFRSQAKREARLRASEARPRPNPPPPPPTPPPPPPPTARPALPAAT